MLCCIACNAGNGIPGVVRQRMDALGVTDAQIGLVVISAKDGKVRFGHRERAAMSPASTMKVLTTIVGLDTLGINYRWKTAVLAQSSPRDGHLQGPIFLRGGAEPDLSWDQLALMLRQLRELGVRDLEGDIVIDRSFFSPARFDLNVPPFDSTPAQAYNVIPDALLINKNLLALHIDSTHGDPVVHFLPPLDGVTVNSALTTSDEPCNEWDEEWPVPAVQQDGGNLTVTLHGTFPRDCVDATSTNILDRNQYVSRLIRSLWRELGGTWNGALVDGVTAKDAKVLVEHESAPLADIVKLINKHSDNTMARNLFLTLGRESAHGSDTPSLVAGESTERDWLRQRHINDHGLVLENGSGLSRIERISPIQMTSVLHEALRSPWSPEFVASLPVYGTDGTMAHRPGGQLAAGAARIKGGTLDNTTSIAGYVHDRRGEDWIVVAFINRPDAEAGRPVLDELIGWVANHPHTVQHVKKKSPAGSANVEKN